MDVPAESGDLTAWYRRYVARCAFPDYSWDLRHLFVEGCWLSAHFLDTGTHLGNERLSDALFPGCHVSPAPVSTVTVRLDSMIREYCPRGAACG